LKVRIKEETIAGVTVRRVTPASINPANKNRLFVHTHGRAYVVNNGRAGLFDAILFAHRATVPVLSIDYRMPPEHSFPAATDDVVEVWSSLIKDRDPKSMVLGGTSAGGGLTLASTHKLIDLGIPVPGAYSFNNVTAKEDKDGSVTIHFGGDPKADNFLPIVPGWNYMARMYKPGPEILDGSWTFPSAQAVQ